MHFRSNETVTWIHIEGIHDAKIIEEIGKHFGGNSLVLEDLMSPTQLSKIEAYENYIFIISENFVVSIRENSGELFTPVQNRLHNALGRIRQMRSDHLAYALIDVIVDHYFIALEHLSDQIEVTQEEVITNPTSDVLEKINILRRELLLLRRPILPLRDVIDEVLDGEIALLTQDTHLYFRDVYDHLIQITHTLDTLRSAASGLFDTYTSAVSHRMNEVMKSLIEVFALHIASTRIIKLYMLPIAVIFLIFYAMPVYCQFADLPQDAKTVDIGVNGDGASQTLSLTAVVPVRRINGWAGVFGSRASGDGEVLSEMVKARAQGGFRIGTFGIEAFTDLERNITKGSALTSQIGSYIRPAIYEKETLRISGGIGAFLENIQPHEDLVDFVLRKFDTTSFRWLAFSSIGWQKLNTVLKFTPEVGFKNYKFSAEPAITFSLFSQLSLRLSGSVTYNSEPLTEKWHYTYLSTLRITL